MLARNVSIPGELLNNNVDVTLGITRNQINYFVKVLKLRNLNFFLSLSSYMQNLWFWWSQRLQKLLWFINKKHFRQWKMWMQKRIQRRNIKLFMCRSYVRLRLFKGLLRVWIRCLFSVPCRIYIPPNLDRRIVFLCQWLFWSWESVIVQMYF